MSADNSKQREAFYNPCIFTKGIGYVAVSRFKAGGQLVEAGVFLVDAWCLGVKNAFLTHLTAKDYREGLLARLGEPQELTALEPACGRKLVEQAVAYAGGLGFAPHPDYRKACRVFGGIVSAECQREFTFGNEGKPLYIRGPHETRAQAERIIRQLHLRLGPDNYGYIFGMPLSAGDSAGAHADEDFPGVSR